MSCILSPVTADGIVSVKIGDTKNSFVSQHKQGDRDRNMRQWRKGYNHTHCLFHVFFSAMLCVNTNYSIARCLSHAGIVLSHPGGGLKIYPQKGHGLGHVTLFKILTLFNMSLHYC